MRGVEAWLAPMFTKFPHLPEGGRKFIVSIAPYLALIFGVLGIVGLFVGGVIASMLGMLSGVFALVYFVQMVIPFVLSLASIILLLMAYPGLRDRTKVGWNYVFYGQVLSVLGSVIALAFDHGISSELGAILGTIVGTIIGFWILFEIRPHYMGMPVAGSVGAPAPSAPQA